MKKVITFLLVMVMVLSISGCGQKQQETPQQSGTQSANTEQSDKVIVLRAGSTMPKEGNYIKGLEVFKEKVEEYTNNRVEVKIFPNSELGNERDLIEGVALGTIEMCISSTGPLPNISPDFMVFDLPFIIADRKYAYEVMDGDLGNKILGTLEPKGIKALGFWENGFRYITSNKPIIHPEDAKGLKIRTMENDVHIETFKQLGANPTPMAWSEVFTALQQGTIDAHENAMTTIDTAKIYEVQKYLSLTGHFYSPAVVMINKKLFDSFPKDIQDAILKAEKEARAWERNYCEELDVTLVKAVKDKGMQVTEVDKAEWQKACAGVYEAFKDKINPEYIKVLSGK